MKSSIYLSPGTLPLHFSSDLLSNAFGVAKRHCPMSGYLTPLPMSRKGRSPWVVCMCRPRIVPQLISCGDRPPKATQVVEPTVAETCCQLLVGTWCWSGMS